ncbi:hypothetical protein B0H34DRAFT_719047 [Crassisporium funariophilum]|nr:hypothetical protein B0H34DRAFT_719047 [Crassisporium funariophilum]
MSRYVFLSASWVYDQALIKTTSYSLSRHSCHHSHFLKADYNQDLLNADRRKALPKEPEKFAVTSRLPAFWSKKRGWAVIFLVILIIIGAVVGGAVGGAVGNGGSNRSVSSSNGTQTSISPKFTGVSPGNDTSTLPTATHIDLPPSPSVGNSSFSALP